GHLVLSTLHTRSSLAAIPRIVDLGVEPTVLSEALIGVVSQRLLRRLCQRCAAKTSEPLTPEESAF
ncbi:MAG TPA: type II secretion system protein GspE, partial [Planctomycetes bacterium]|nr:type II secretion system protein GspE [Planctomycetota bacterium]